MQQKYGEPLATTRYIAHQIPNLDECLSEVLLPQSARIL